MINKCKVQIRKRELYNVVKSLKQREREKKRCILREEIESAIKISILVFLFLQQYCPCISPSKLTEAKFFDPSSTKYLL